jgi:hypothetical protein
MGKFLLGVFVGLVVAVLGLLIIGLAVGKLFANKQPTIAGNSVLVLTLEGDLPEAAPVEIPIPFLESRAMPSVRDVWASLHAATADKRIKALVIAPRGLGVG